MHEVERLVDQLEREHGGEPWHGSPLRTVLAGISHSQAAARPLPDAHSIWELVLHVTAWKNEARHRLEGAAAGEPREGDWPAVGQATPERWAEALSALDTAHRLLVSAVKALREENLTVPTNDHRAAGLAPTHYELLMGIIQHDVYHAGQIAVLKKGSAR